MHEQWIFIWCCLGVSVSNMWGLKGSTKEGEGWKTLNLWDRNRINRLLKEKKTETYTIETPPEMEIHVSNREKVSIDQCCNEFRNSELKSKVRLINVLYLTLFRLVNFRVLSRFRVPNRINLFLKKILKSTLNIDFDQP